MSGTEGFITKFEDLFKLAEDGVQFAMHPTNESGEIDLTAIGEDLANILRHDLHLPIPDNFQVTALHFGVKK